MTDTVITVPYQYTFNHNNYGCDFLTSGPMLPKSPSLLIIVTFWAYPWMPKHITKVHRAIRGLSWLTGCQNIKLDHSRTSWGPKTLTEALNSKMPKIWSWVPTCETQVPTCSYSRLWVPTCKTQVPTWPQTASKIWFFTLFSSPVFMSFYPSNTQNLYHWLSTN